MMFEDATDREKSISRVLAVAMHLVFLILLVVGVSWQKRASEPGVVVELWNSMTPPKPEMPAPAPAPKPEPKPEPKVEQPPPEPKAEPRPVLKPDISLKERVDKDRKKDREEIDKKKEEDAKRKLKAQQELEARKKEDEKRKVEKERVAEDAEAKRLAQEKQQAVKQLADQQAAAQSQVYDKYTALIRARIRNFIVEPQNLQGNPQVEFDVVLIPGGEVLSAKLAHSSGVRAYDEAVERAILKASPLPLPPDPTLFPQFRELHLKIRPKE
jgi:colicin import membrane protein